MIHSSPLLFSPDSAEFSRSQDFDSETSSDDILRQLMEYVKLQSLREATQDPSQAGQAVSSSEARMTRQEQTRCGSSDIRAVGQLEAMLEGSRPILSGNSPEPHSINTSTWVAKDLDPRAQTQHSDLEVSAMLESMLDTIPCQSENNSPLPATGNLRPSNLPGHYLDHQSCARSTAFSEEEVSMMLHFMVAEKAPFGEPGHDITGDMSLLVASFQDSVGRQRKQHQP